MAFARELLGFEPEPAQEVPLKSWALVLAREPHPAGEPVASAIGRVVSAAFLKDERERRGEDYFAQEYLCQFLDRDSHLFGGYLRSRKM